MAVTATSKVDEEGTIRLPADLRHLFGMVEGATVIAEARADGILLRPAGALPPEVYTPERKAEFLLGSAVDAEDYARAVEEVRAMGLDPDKIDHHRPAGA
jgi:bifunctional DNA-binding transcriptional regulator/antitoxin component of YhaV-PrlF toxin-antitoxin module